MRIFLVPALLLAVVFLAVPHRAAAEDVALASLVGSDVGLCVELHDARAAVDQIERSAWLARLKDSKIFQAWMQSDDVRKFRQSVAAVEKVVNQPPRKFLMGLFGRQAIVAVYPRSEGDPVAVVLTLADSEAAVEHALKIWNDAEPTQIVIRTHAGKSYARRVRTQRKDRPAETMFYFHEGTLLVLSDSEKLVRQAMERVEGDAQRSLAAHVRWQGLHATGDQSTVRALVQPQAWRKPDDASDGDDSLPSLLRSWRTCEAVTLSARLDGGLLVDAAAYFPKESASPRWLRFVERSRGAFPSFDRIPAEALFVVAARVDLGETAAILDELIPVAQRKHAQRLRQVARGLLLGLDFPNDVLPNLGPEFAAWIAPNAASADAGDEAETFPWEAAVVCGLKTPAVEQEVGEGKEAAGKRPRTPVPTALDNALNTGLNLLVAMFNADEKNPPVIVQDETLGANGASPETAPEVPAKSRALQVRLRWVEGLPFVRPAFAATAERLLFATDAETIRRVLANSAPDEPADALAENPAFQAMRKRVVESPTQLAYVNVAGVRQSLEANAKRVVRHAIKNGEKADEVEKKLVDVGDLLSLFDDVFLAIRLDETEVRATFGATVR